MENLKVARIFNEIADILELQEENPFRIRSYRKAAQNIEELSENLENIAEKNELQDIPGIGKGTANKIKEIIKTGKCKYHQELKDTPEANLIEMMHIPGFGPKKAKQVYQELNIVNIEELEKAVKEGKLRKLEGMGKKSEQKILKGIHQFKQSRGRFILSEALPYAETIIEKLNENNKEIIDINYAGSLRRMKETVGDLDILVTAKGKSNIMDNFTSLTEVKDIVAKGNTKSSVILNNGLQVDLRLIKPESYGAAMVYFTGSKQHNIAIREISKKKNLKVSEYGVFSTVEKKEKKVAGKTEKKVYNSVGLTFIPPELRENSGEIEAAKKGKLPDLITMDDYKGDLQMHTKYSDGGHTIEEMAKACLDKGYKYMAITDHSKAVRVAGGLKPEELLKEIEEIKKVNKKIKEITVLTGVEVDILDEGKLDLPDEVLEKCDVVFAAIHYKFRMEKAEMTQRIINSFKNKNVNVLAHPTGRILKKRGPYKVNMDKIIKAAKKYNVALELNSYPDRLDLDSKYCKACKENGTKISINTDSHNVMQLDNTKYGINTARRGWLEASDVINTYSLPELKNFLNKK